MHGQDALINPTPLGAVAVDWDEIPAPPCMVMLGCHPSLRDAIISAYVGTCPTAMDYQRVTVAQLPDKEPVAVLSSFNWQLASGPLMPSAVSVYDVGEEVSL
jgi:hypothetical protein